MPMKTIKILLPLCLMLIGISLDDYAKAQAFSYINKYQTIYGGSELVAYSHNHEFEVRCVNNGFSLHSQFLVLSNTGEKGFIDVQPPAGPMISCDSGYIVKGIDISNNVCWFYGKKWTWDGTYIYKIDGTMVPKLVYSAIIGKFPLASVANGSGYYYIWDYSKMKEVHNLAAHGDGATAVITYDTGHYVKAVLELICGNNNSCTYRVETSTHPEEVFMDVTNANGKVVVLSRFNNPIHSQYYNYRFGLRYGTPFNFLNTSNKIYCYDTEAMFGDQRAKFLGLEPIHLCSTNKNNGVAVTHLVSYAAPNGNMKGRYASYIIPAEGSNNDILVHLCKGSNTYSKIQEVKFNLRKFDTVNIGLLLYDSIGNSVLRFPLLTPGNNNTDQLLTIDEPKIESIAPYYFTYSLDVLAVGHYQNTGLQEPIDSKVYGIHDHMSFWNTQNCFTTSERSSATYTGFVFGGVNIINNNALFRFKYGSRPFKPIAFQSSAISKTLKCDDGTEY